MGIFDDEEERLAAREGEERLPESFSCMEVGHWREFAARFDWFYGEGDETAWGGHQ